MRLLAVFGLILGWAGALAAQDRCHVIPERDKLTMPRSASEGSLRFAGSPECPVKTDGVTWVSYDVVPPGTATMASTLKIWVTPNPLSEPREGKIHVGDAELTIAQDGGLPSMSFSPSRLEFSAKVGDTAAVPTKSIFVGSSAAFSLSAKADNSDWLSVVPEGGKEGPQKQHKFVVTVRPGKLTPGEYKAVISLQTSGASNSQETIPVMLRILPESLDGK